MLGNSKFIEFMILYAMFSCFFSRIIQSIHNYSPFVSSHLFFMIKIPQIFQLQSKTALPCKFLINMFLNKKFNILISFVKLMLLFV